MYNVKIARYAPQVNIYSIHWRQNRIKCKNITLEIKGELLILFDFS